MDLATIRAVHDCQRRQRRQARSWTHQFEPEINREDQRWTKQKSKRNHKRENKTNQTSEALILAESTFSHAAEGSDEGSRSVMKWCGVPHWENQPKCTSGSIDPGLVGLGDLEKHP